MSIDTGNPQEFAARVRENQRKLAAQLRRSYDFIVCGSGSSGAVVARRLAENPDVHVLLLEAGGSDDVANVTDPIQWKTNLGSERDWGFITQPNPHLNGRAIPLNAGRVLGGGSSINVMMWARGHKNDWDFFAAQSGGPAWSYESVLGIYRRIEDWRGIPDPEYRGTSGPLFVQQPQDPHPLAAAVIQAARSVGIPSFSHQNGRMMEGDGGATFADLRIRDGKRQTLFRSYTYPYMDRPNLTVLTAALVTRLISKGAKVIGVEFLRDGHRRPGRVATSRNPLCPALALGWAKSPGSRRGGFHLGVARAAESA
jgi:choline dehydrogenase